VKTERSADLWLLLITFLWGFSFVVVKGALSFAGPYWFLFLRFSLAGLAGLILLRGSWPRLNRQAVGQALMLSLVLYGGFAFQTLGLQFTSPAKSAFITAVCVVLVPIFGLVIFRVRVSREVGLGIVTAFAGLYLLLRPDNLAAVNRGDILTFGCAVVFAFHILLVSRYARITDPGILAVLQLVFTALWSLPLALIMDDLSFSYPWSFYLALVYLSVFCSALAFSIQIRAQRKVPASRAALIFALEPVFAAATSMVLIGEHLLWREWLGGGLVVLGVFWGEASVLRSKYGTGAKLKRIKQCQNELG
jgi:drug/metabolite transporter (DMT)-like permease